jgi:Holliday junction DNA helicase RuvB
MSVVTTLNHVIGQERAVAILKTALDAHWNEHAKSPRAFPHTLITGAGGLGKTFMAELLAQELCTKVHVELAQNLGKKGEMLGLLVMVEDEHLLFLDEIHQLSESATVCLYRALEDGFLFVTGSRKPLQLPSFTLIGATTHEYRLTTSLRDRFKILLRLTHYTEHEMTRLLGQRAYLTQVVISEACIRELAKRSRGVPRLGVRMLDAAKRMASSVGSDEILPEHI